MASAISLNAAATINSGQGLSVNADMSTAIATFKNLGTVTTVANIFSTAANVAANAYPVLISSLETLGSGVGKSQWLIDFWPSNITPTSSNTVSVYGNTTASASFIKTISTQANLPFDHGLAGFANVYQASYGYAIKSFDTVSSVSLLQDKTYADGGIGHSGIHDTITGGLGTNTALFADVVANWGTMYDVANLNLFADPYVFGQNLLNHGLGSYGNLAVNFTAAGLDTSDITKTPATVTTKTQVESALTTNTIIGPVDLPVLASVSSTNEVKGSSTDVVMSIYQKITGSDLEAIVSATGITTDGSSRLTTLADYLDFNKVISLSQRPELSALNINTLNEFGTYLHSKIGQATFASWREISTFLHSIEVPILNYTTTSASTKILSDAAISAINNTATGTGPLGNPVMSDFLGATAGINYATNLGTLISSYGELYSTIYSTLQTLDSAVVDWKNGYVASPEYIPPITPVSAAVTAVNSALKSLPATTKFSQAEKSYIDILNQLTMEVSNLSKAGVIFGAGTTDQLDNFSQRFADSASDKDKYQTYQLITSLITHDANGDTLRATIAESINYYKLLSVGISVNNNPDPAAAINSAATQNVSLTTYLSQNK
jgi:hypothetical protein